MIVEMCSGEMRKVIDKLDIVTKTEIPRELTSGDVDGERKKVFI
jgi:hypothetical protein